MANLIPPDARTKVKYEYWARVVTLWLFLVGVATIMVTLIQIPAYVLIKEQTEVFTQWYEEVSDDNEQFKQSVEIIERTNEISRVIYTEEGHTSFSNLVDEIRRIETDEISVETIAIEKKGGAFDTFSVSGEAATRSALADFRIAIEASPLFEAAALPLSNLAKDVDIPFNISVTVHNADDV